MRKIIDSIQAFTDWLHFPSFFIGFGWAAICFTSVEVLEMIYRVKAIYQ